jgi:hypothetical protein
LCHCYGKLPGSPFHYHALEHTAYWNIDTSKLWGNRKISLDNIGSVSLFYASGFELNIYKAKKQELELLLKKLLQE